LKQLIVIFAAGLAFAFAGQVKTNQPAPDFTLTDTQGKSHSLKDFKGKYVVLEWVNFGCPFVKKHYDSGNMQKLQKQYTDKDVVWLSICSSAAGKQGHYSAEEAEKMRTEHKSNQTAYLIDESGEVGKTYGARTTPHMFVIDPQGKLIYQGAIDSIRSTDKADVDKADNYVEMALDAAMAGDSIAKQETQPYGCSVKY